MGPGAQVDRSRVVQVMRRNALFSLAAGALFVGVFLLEAVQGRSLAAPSLALVILGGGMLAVSIRILLPSYPQSVQRRFARVEARTEEQQKANLVRGFRNPLLLALSLWLIE